MLAARNKRFRIAAAIGALSYLILAAGEIVEMKRVLDLFGAPTGYGISAVAFPATHIVGAAGWTLVAGAFSAELEWKRLRQGAAVVFLALAGYGGAMVLRTVVELEPGGSDADEVLYIVLAAVTALLTAVAVAVILVGCAESRRGAPRGRLLRWGVAVGALSFLVAAAALSFELVSYLNLADEFETDLPSEFIIGTIVAAAGSVGTAIAAGIFARGATRPLERREAALFAAGVAAVGAALMIVVGEGLIAYLYRHTSGSLLAPHLLQVGGRFASTVSIVFIALGARAAVRATAAKPDPA
jgi:hypothetical protein